MNTDQKKSFLNDLKKITDPALKAEIKQVIETVKKANSMQDISQLKKLKGYRISYRIRVGNYRIGVEIVGNLITFLKCLPRKDFYKYFP